MALDAHPRVAPGRHRSATRGATRISLSSASVAGIALALLGIAASGGAAVTTDLAAQQTSLASAEPRYLYVVPGTVTPLVQRETIGVRERLVEADARKAALAREAARQLAARQLAARQLAARQLAARQLAARKLAAARAAARKAAAARAPARASRLMSRAAPVSAGTARAIARDMLDNYGWALSQFDCLDPLWMRESGWRVNAANSSSGAYGIPQALPGSKMATAGADWQTNAATQITWGLGYIRGRYGSPCGAWAHFQSHNWY